MSSNLQNSIWPNAGGTLGQIKVQIPTGTADDPWPEGDALVGNFVYKNGKLVGFIDTAALIPNEGGETTIPYDTVNTKFPGILKDSFIINPGERCKYQFAKLEEDIVVYTSTRLFEVMDADKFKVSYDKDENKVTVAVSLDTTAAHIAEVESLLDRVLPSNLVTEIDEMPMGFQKLEWIENENNACIDSELYLNSDYEINTAFIPALEVNSLHVIFGNEVDRYRSPAFNLLMANWNMARFDYGTSLIQKYITHYGIGKIWMYEVNKNNMNISIPELNISTSILQDYTEFECTRKHYVFGLSQNGVSTRVRLLSLAGKVNEVPQFDFIPAYDKEVGAPCLFDKVRRKVFYNVGTGDFTYPGKEEEPTTYSLRKLPMYAQYTEHGIRRLYRVPEGYSSKEEYAEANGFKLLVETPMPEEGYWAPVWHDREDCIELEWVEAEPPPEETSI